MNLLSDLTLAYEMLADDPIEVGIHYGKSILNILSEAPAKMGEHVAAPLPSRQVETKQPLMSRQIARSRFVGSRTTRDQSPRLQTSYAPRRLNIRARDYYSQRNLVGAL